MDIATLAGIIAGFGLIIGTIIPGGGGSAFIDLPSVMVVVGGSTAATLINFNMSQFVAAIKIASKTLKSEQDEAPALIADGDIERVAQHARPHVDAGAGRRIF